MNTPESSIVRLLNARGQAVGAGCLVSANLVMTCAHVVEAALGSLETNLTLQADLPLVSEPGVFDAQLTFFDREKDIACLAVKTYLPDQASPTRLIIEENLWGHSFRVFGFPHGHPNGVWASGVLRSSTGEGWLQIEDLKDVGFTIQPGFSGGPVWDDQLGGVVGIISAVTTDRSIKAAFCIPSRALMHFYPDLKETSMPACPYRGLFAFREQDQDLFFGREIFTNHLLEAISHKNLVALIGPSGTGKSSLIFAGLVPQLRKDQGCSIVTFRPGSQPFESLALSLVPWLEPSMTETDRLVELRKLAAALQRNDLRIEDLMARLLQKEAANKLILIADQFEELYTLCTDPGLRQQFIDLLLDARSTAGVTLLLILRADFLGQALSYLPLTEALQHSDLKLGPMSIDELRQAMEKPARVRGVEFEPGLSDLILKHVENRSGALPLVEFVLTQLWDQQANGRLVFKAYQEIGTVERALAKYAEDVFGRLTSDEREIAHRIFIQLVHPGEGTEDTRRIALRREMNEETWSLIQRLADLRLVVTDQTPDNQESVEIVHEALIREWGRLQEWMELDRSFRTWQERLRTDIKHWMSSGKNSGYLLRGAPLAEAVEWLEKRAFDVSDSEQDYIRFSVLLDEQEKREKEEMQRQLDEMQSSVNLMRSQLETAERQMNNVIGENANLYSSEHTRRQAAEALTKSARQLSSLGTVDEVPQQIVAQLAVLIPNDHSAVFLEDVNGTPRLFAHGGFPDNVPIENLVYTLRDSNVYHLIARQSDALLIGDLKSMQGWNQPNWAPEDRAWLGVPLYSKNKVIGMLSLTRRAANSFNQDEVLLATTFAIQASIALENARLYDDMSRFNQMMERMIEQRVDELDSAYRTIQKLDKSKSEFIQVASHELRTPLTVIKGYVGMIKAKPAIQNDAALTQAIEGVMQGTNRLQQIVNSMLDVARLENQVLTPHLESVPLGPLVRLICKDYAEDLQQRRMMLDLDPGIDSAPQMLADSELLKKALDQVISNAIKFTPDGGSIFISAQAVTVSERGEFCETRIRDTGIGIDPANHSIIFEKLYQLGNVAFHSSEDRRRKSGGLGLGLAIAAGIVKAHRGKIWVESPGYDEEKLPGSTFVIQIPVAK